MHVVQRLARHWPRRADARPFATGGGGAKGRTTVVFKVRDDDGHGSLVRHGGFRLVDHVHDGADRAVDEAPALPDEAKEVDGQADLQADRDEGGAGQRREELRRLLARVTALVGCADLVDGLRRDARSRWQRVAVVDLLEDGMVALSDRLLPSRVDAERALAGQRVERLGSRAMLRQIL